MVDPAAWYEEGSYCALIGSKNRRPGYEGDCTSLFTSPDLIRWEYQGPFYRSRREWTLEGEDAACPDFFPIGEGSPTRRAATPHAPDALPPPLPEHHPLTTWAATGTGASLRSGTVG